MNLTLQDFVALGLVLLAVCYLGRKAWLVVAAKKTGCGGGCRSCPTSKAPANGQLVSIAPPPKRESPRGPVA